MKQIVATLMFIFMISISGIVVEGARAERLIRVYGTVTIDSEGVDGADITVTNIDRDEVVTTTTNDSGYYEVFIKAVDNNKIKVSVNTGEYSNEKSFVLEKFQSNYEVNFEFESGSTVIIVNKVVDFFHGFEDIVDWFKGLDFFSILVYLILLLMVLCLIKKVFFGKYTIYKIKRRDD